MYKYKVLLKITGSIAAYKSAYLISKLMQNNYEVQVVATEAALEFIGKATLEGLTGKIVYTDTFEDGEMMSHINLVKWADIVVLAPASGNTINKMAAGIADNILLSLFLAHDKNKPYLIAPAMNTNMYLHPATQEAISKLQSWGVNVLPTADGYLACGDVGAGKLLEPDDIFNHIENTLKKNRKNKTILITSGGTRENIDGIRHITNLSTGNTGANIADAFSSCGYDVTYLHSIDAKLPSVNCNLQEFEDYNYLSTKVFELISEKHIDAVIHLAAVSDYSVKEIKTGNSVYEVPLKNKLTSDEDEIEIKLIKNNKIINEIKNRSKNKNVNLVGFKFTNTEDENKRLESALKLQTDSDADLVVLNDASNREENKIQNSFSVIENSESITLVNSSKELGNILIGKIFNNDTENK